MGDVNPCCWPPESGWGLLYYYVPMTQTKDCDCLLDLGTCWHLDLNNEYLVVLRVSTSTIDCCQLSDATWTEVGRLVKHFGRNWSMLELCKLRLCKCGKVYLVFVRVPVYYGIVEYPGNLDAGTWSTNGCMWIHVYSAVLPSPQYHSTHR